MRQPIHARRAAVALLAAVSSAGAAPHKDPTYTLMGVLDFVIDGPVLASHGARVDVGGVYIREGSVDVLYADTMALARSHTGDPQPRVVVITENSTRALRARLVNCQTDGYSAELGCPVTIRGRVALCAVTSTFGVQRQEPCLEAEGEAPPKDQASDTP